MKYDVHSLVIRKVSYTVCDVLLSNGDVIDDYTVWGKRTVVTMANSARRKFRDPLATIRNCQAVSKTYQMPLDKFAELAEEITEEKE